MRRTTVLLLSVALCASAAHAQLAELVFGRADGWSDLSALQGTRLVPGRWGDLDLVLDDALDITGSSGTDLWLSFDASRQPFGRYRLSGAPADRAPTVTGAEFVRGGSSGVFHGTGGMRLVPSRHSLLAPGTLSSDFSLQFWLYPAAMQDGEELLGWSGSVGGGSAADVGGGEQQLLATIHNRRVRWHLEGLFRAADGTVPAAQTLTGLSPLVPHQWHHHLLRFDSRFGTLEYLVDGTPHAISHVTSTSREGGTPGAPWVGTGRQSPLRVGDTFVGLMDEVHFSTTVAEPELSRYRGRAGWAATRVFDLGHPDSSVIAVDVVSDTARSNAEIFYYYRIADLPFSPPLPAQDAAVGPVPVQFDPSQPLVDAPRGRYLQLMFELLPSGATASADGRRTDRSPHLQEVRVRYMPVVPPPPPRQVSVAAGDGAVRVTWRPATGALGGEIGGYLVFYGTRPGQYLTPASVPTPGSVADQGPSPIDVGGANELVLTGLENGTVYYVAVSSYDGFEPPQLSPFSTEVTARPSAVRRLQVRAPGADDASLAGAAWPTQR